MSGLLKLWHSKRNPPALPTTSFKNKTILITGSNTGLGLAAARHFLRLHATHIILAVRSIQKGEAAQDQLEREFGKKGAVSVMHLDMNDFASVRGFAEKLNQIHTHLHIALLNAGIVNRTYQTSPSGFEETLQVNTLSTTLLALLLLPILRDKNPKAPTNDETKNEDFEWTPRLILVSSGTHSTVKRSALPEPLENIFKTLSDPPGPGNGGKFSGQKRYALSKLLLMYNFAYLSVLGRSPHSQSLSSLPSPPQKEVIVTSCCPGMVKTDLGRQYNSWYMLPFLWLIHSLARTPEEGARTLVSATTLGREAAGGFWKNDQLVEVNPLLVGKEGREIGEVVWEETKGILGVKDGAET